MHLFKRISAVAMVVATVAIGCFVGCESEEDAVSLTITPSPYDMTVRNGTVLLTVSEGLRDLSLPITWSVSRPEFGTIDPSFRGAAAVYVGQELEGVNLVTAEDQYGAKGYATINHTFSTTNGPGIGERVSLTAVPSPITPGYNSSTVTATSGTAPYSWSVGDPAYGSLSGASGNPVVYTSSRAGQNTIYVVDRDGRQGSITIEQQ